jgi:CCR4-NOT transcription complex subunit 6
MLTVCQGLNRLILKDNVALMVLLEMWSTRQRVLVANTHIHWDPSFSDVKLVQTKMFLEKLAALQRAERVPLLVCGDFNSLPDSGVYDLITSGALTRDHKDLRSHSYGSYSRDGMRHDLALVSCYPPDATPYTNCTHDFRGVLDYIFVSAESVRVASILSVVPLEQLPFPALPNAHSPSDHVLLLASVLL